MSHCGYYGLRVNPTLDQAIKTVRKPLRIPVPDRRAKWYALSPYRALILDAERRANDIEGALLDYRNSGAQLPEHAARVRGSAAGEDDAWMHISDDNDRLHDQHQHEEARAEAMEREAATRAAAQQQHQAKRAGEAEAARVLRAEENRKREEEKTVKKEEEKKRKAEEKQAEKDMKKQRKLGGGGASSASTAVATVISVSDVISDAAECQRTDAGGAEGAAVQIVAAAIVSAQ
jgi:flagellar biosynthesis GTPase FlhF